MVHIINGEIVSDDDPRVRERKAGSNAARPAQGGFGTIGGTSSRLQQTQQPAPAPPQPSPLQNMARSLGLEGAITIPSILGMPARPIQKIHLALAALLTLLFGWRALVFLAFVFFVSTQQQQAPQ